MSAASWHRVADRIRDAVLRDDGQAAVKARLAVEEAIAQAPNAAATPDPDLFKVLVKAARRWAARIHPVERRRFFSTVSSAAQAVCDLAREDLLLEREHREARQRDHEMAKAGLPVGDRE
ncbi:hypothetical protein [Hyphobacterium sp.]|uniref:hypothetical protein n=1 Tax=Hyphobacterium sp. TaxID=2004662 RepID=UPI003BACFC5D